jgi:hypothetical protein
LGLGYFLGGECKITGVVTLYLPAYGLDFLMGSLLFTFFLLAGLFALGDAILVDAKIEPIYPILFYKVLIAVL